MLSIHWLVHSWYICAKCPPHWYESHSGTSVNSRRQGRPPPAPGHRLPPRRGWTRPRSPRSAVAAAWGSIAGKSWSSVGLEEKREMGSFNDFRVERGARIMHSLSASDWKRESHWADFFQSTSSIKSWLCLIPMPCLFLFKWDFASKESYIISLPPFNSREGKGWKWNIRRRRAITDFGEEEGRRKGHSSLYFLSITFFPKDRHEWADNGKKWESFKLQTSNYFIRSSFRSPIQYSLTVWSHLFMMWQFGVGSTT